MSKLRLGRKAGVEGDAATHVMRESLTMVLYLAIVLLSVHLARADDADKAEDIALLWGTAIGLGLAHLFAYDLTAIFADRGRMTRVDVLGAVGIAFAVVGTALVASLPYVFIDEPEDASTASTVLLFGLICLTAFSSARRAGANKRWAAVFTVVAAVLAAVTVLIKYTLTH